MENQHAGGPQVPFGDGSHVPMEDPRTVYKSIFTSCDVHNTGLVLASELILYVTPFLSENEIEFRELKMLLDPSAMNSALNSEDFIDIMIQWTLQVRNDKAMKQISSNVTSRETDEIQVRNSSPRNNLGDTLCRIGENEVLNISYSANTMESSDSIDVHALHEQMKQLQHENRKISGELKELKSQLITTEEQNEALHLDYEKLLKKYKAKERQLKEELQKNKKSSAEILETSTSARKHVLKLEKLVAKYEKEVNELKKNVSNLESKKKKLEDSNKEITANEIELQKVIFNLEAEMNLKDQEVAALEGETTNLHAQLVDHQENINHYVEINECLKLENSKIEKRFREHISETMESRNSSLNDASLNSPIQGILKKMQQHNSAVEFLRTGVTPPQMQLNPSRRLSSNLNDVQKLRILETKKSIDSDEGSTMFCNKLLTNAKFDEVFSTPIKPSMLLDASLPCAARNIPQLSPLIIDNDTPTTPPSSQHQMNDSPLSSTPSVRVNVGNNGTNSLPTMFIIERSDPVTGGSINDDQSNAQVVDSGSSTSDMFWKVQLLNQSKSNSDQSLQSELLRAEEIKADEQANFTYSVSKRDFDNLENRIMDYEKTIKELLDEVNRLKISQSSSSDLVVNLSKSRRGSLDSCLKMKEGCVTLQNKIENLEYDSNQKYIKIVDLMEEIEKLKQIIDQLKCGNTELELERETLQDKLTTLLNNQVDFERNLSQLNTIKEAHEELQKKFQRTLESERMISTEFDIFCGKNDDLNFKLKDLMQIVDRLTTENAEKSSDILTLKEENSRLEYRIAANAEETADLISTRNNLNLRVNQMRHENENLKESLNKTDKEHQNVMQRCHELTNTKQQYLDEMKNLKLKVAENANCIENFKTEIENLKIENQALIQDVNAKKSQTDVLKQMIEYQNVNLEVLKTERNTFSEKMYAYEIENENVLKVNKKLSEEFKNFDKEKLAEKVKSLEELNKGSHMEIQSLLDEVKSVKDNNNSIQVRLDSLLIENENLKRSTENLKHSIQALKDEKRLIEEKLEKIEQEHRITLKDHKLELKIKDDLNSQLVIEIEEKSDAIAMLSKKQTCKNCSLVQQTIKKYELTISDLESKIKYEERKPIVASYDRLQMRIERQEEKINDKDECLQQREGEIKDLELKNIELKIEYDDLKTEKDQLFAECCSLQDQLAQKSTLENKFRKNLEEIQKFQNEIKVLNEEKATQAREFKTFKNKSKSMLEKKDARLHVSATEIINFKKEIEGLQKRNAELENSVEKTKAASMIGIEKEKQASSKTKLMKDNLDCIKKDNVQLKLDLEELNKRYSSLNKRNNDSLERIGRENSMLKQQIAEGLENISETGKKLEKAQHDLQKSEVKNLSIRKVLTDVQSNVCEGLEDAMVKSMEIQNFQEMVKEKTDEIAFLQDELKVCQRELAEVKANLIEVNKSFNDLSDYVHVIKEGLGERRHRLARSTLTVVNAWHLKLESIPENRTLLHALNHGESLNPTETFTGLLDDEMYRLKNQIHITSLFLDLIGSLKSGNHNVETQASPLVHQKTSTKYTPNENHRSTDTTEYFYSEKCLQTPQNISPVKSQGCMTICTTRDQSPETSGLHIIDQSGDTLSLEEPTNSILDTNESRCKAIRLLNIASPNLSDILEQMELVKDDSTAWTSLELEEQFTILQAAFANDCTTVEERYQNQQSVQCRVEEKFTIETEKLVTTLISIQKLGRERELDTLVNQCLRQVEHVVCTFSQASVSAMQYGALYHEQKIVLGVNFMILHSIYLQDTIGNSVRQFKSINTRNTEGSENSLEALQRANIVEVEQNNEITSNSECDDVGTGNNFGTKSLKDGSNIWWWTFACLLVVLFVLYYAITESPVFDCNSCGYPWSWLSWTDFWFAFDLNYFNGPPPI